MDTHFAQRRRRDLIVAACLAAVAALVPRAEACHAALARLHVRLALQLLTGMAGPAGRGHRSAARPVRIEIAA